MKKGILDIQTKKEGSMDLSPQEIVHELNKYVIGQTNAKKSVAIALRNRSRRKQVPDDLQNEILSKEYHYDRTHWCWKNRNC